MTLILELGPNDFVEGVVCLGRQLESIVCAVEKVQSGLLWYSADAAPAPKGSGLNSGSQFRRIKGITAVPDAFKSVSQFLRGVFVGIANTEFSRIGFEVDTEVLEPLPVGQPFVQIHCFDTSLFWIATNKENVYTELLVQFKGRK